VSTVESGPSPLLVRERLADWLRQARLDAGLSQADAAVKVEWSLSKLTRIENGVVRISVTDARGLGQAYGVAEHVLERWTAMARVARQSDQYRSFNKYFSSEYRTLLAYEASSDGVREVNTFVLPGMLQTEAHARALLSVRHSGESLESLVKARMIRKEGLYDEARTFELVIDEAALHRRIGGLDVHVEQLAHLLKVSYLPHVRLRVIPFEASAHLGLWESYMILTIPASELMGSPAETVVYRELGESEYLIRQDLERLAPFEEGFEAILAQSLDADASRELIEDVKQRLES
jgi:transcriptional regulator with XRE-family HTH domain